MARAARSYYAALGLEFPNVRIRHSAEVTTPFEMHLTQRGRDLDVLVDLGSFRATSHSMKRRACAHWYWLAQAPSVSRIVCDVSDGHWSGLARFSYSSNSERVIPVPDFYFFRDRGYADSDAAGAQAPDWNDRSDEIVWRGQPNGIGLFTTDAELMGRPGIMQRMHMAFRCKGLENVDFRFVGGGNPDMSGQLRSLGYLADPIPQDSWAGRKFAIDIDGITNAWDNFLRRLKMGCCVLKVASPFGFRQWYYDRLVPFEHFVPIRADLSDLQEQVEWVRTHPTRARDIAEAGQAVARSMTFESEAAVAGQLIEEHAV